MHKAALLWFASALLLTGCSPYISEATVIRPVAAPRADLAALAAAVPDYAVEALTLPTVEATLEGVRFRRDDARATVIYFGGNQFTVARLAPLLARQLAPLRVNVVVFDHRGYGASTGTAGFAALKADGETIFDAVSARWSDGLPLIVHGQSLGSFVAGHVAAVRPASGVVLESSATTTADWVGGSMGPVQKTLVRPRIDPAIVDAGNAAVIGAIEEPVLLLVGAQDRTTPPSMSQALYAGSPLPEEDKTLQVIPGAGHNNVLLHPAALAAYGKFLDKTAASR